MTVNLQSDPNMLFGILSLQRGYVRERDLIAAMHAWALVPKSTLADLLVERRALTESQAREVERLVCSRSPPPPETAHDVTPATVAPSSSPPPPQRYQVVRPYARGGLGEVFVARDEELGREVALKQIQERWAEDPNNRKRFVLEAQITGGLEHPGIVPVYGLGEDAEGKPFYAMRLIRGETLRDAIVRHHRSSPDHSRPPRDLLSRFVSVCNTIAYAHSRGVIHRDLKPSNVMLGPFGETLVVDWGLAKVLDSAEAFPVSPGTDTQISVPGVPFGTPEYVAPEQAAGRLHEIDERTDTYMLGGILYEILTCQPPHADGRAGRPAPPVRSLIPDVPPGLELIVHRALDPSRERRFANAAELGSDVDRWLAGDGAFATVPPSPLVAPIEQTPPPAGGRWAAFVAPERYSELQELTVGRTTLTRLCLDEDLNRLVVLKEVRPEFAEDRNALAALSREAQINAQLDHPNVRALHGIGRHPDGRPFLVLHYVRGQDLHQAVRAYHDLYRRPSPRDPELLGLLSAFVGVCRAVAYAHRRGVIHGAVRASNVLLGVEGETSLIDWGESSLIKAVRGGDVELSDWVEPGDQTKCPNGDVFALGAMLYHLLVGRPPHSPLGRVRDRASWVPADLESLCAQVMGRDEDGHRITASQLGDAVERIKDVSRVKEHKVVR